MTYEFKCQSHGVFTVEQPMLSEHKLKCPKCGAECIRVYPKLRWHNAGQLFREDGSYRQDEDYAILKG